MIPVLVDGVKKYLLTEEEVDAKISASGGGSSSENLYTQMDYFTFTNTALSKLSGSMFGDLTSSLYVEFANGSIVNLEYAAGVGKINVDPVESPELKIVRVWFNKSAEHSMIVNVNNNEFHFTLDSVAFIAMSAQTYTNTEWRITGITIEP